MKMKKLLALVSLIAVCYLFYVPAGLADPVRIMPLGDSITGSPGCWRALLWKNLTDNGYTNIDFVGTAPHQGCAIEFDPDHEGHGGAWVASVAQNNELVGWLSATNPDIVLMHFGTNDIWNPYTSIDEVVIPAYTTLVNQMRQNNPNMIILVAQIIPLDPDFCSESEPKCPQPQRAIDLNEAILPWAQGLSTKRSPIVVVNQYDGFDPSTDTGDGVHPNENGNKKIAATWYNALAPILAGEMPEEPVCSASEIAPKMQINDGPLIQTDTASVTVGDHLILSPEAANGDEWYWYGPNGFASTIREVFLYNIQTYHGGTYSVAFTNDCGATSTHDFTVSVQTQPGEPEPTPNNTGGCDGNGPRGGCGWNN